MRTVRLHGGGYQSSPFLASPSTQRRRTSDAFPRVAPAACRAKLEVRSRRPRPLAGNVMVNRKAVEGFYSAADIEACMKKVLVNHASHLAASLVSACSPI
eukprot:3533407-Pleurochrysis_carterae.AAC.1